MVFYEISKRVLWQALGVPAAEEVNFPQDCMPDRDTWEFINTFAPWLSAIGTITAVIVSLYLARRSTRPEVRVSAGVVEMIGRGIIDPMEFLEINAINHGVREVVVQKIIWQFSHRPFKRQLFIVIPPDDPFSTKLPARLQHGDEASFLFPTDTFQKDGKSLLSCLREPRSASFAVRRLRAGVYLSTGQMFVAPLNKWSREWMIEQVKEVNAPG